MSHKEITTIQTGKDGLTNGLMKHIKEVLKVKELVKIKILDTYACPVKETAEAIMKETKAEIIRIIGNTFVLYKESTELEEDKRIILPQ